MGYYLTNLDGSITYYNGAFDKNSGNIVWSPNLQGTWNRNVGSYTAPWNGNTYGRTVENSDSDTKKLTSENSLQASTATTGKTATTGRKKLSYYMASRLHTGQYADRLRELGFTSNDAIRDFLQKMLDAGYDLGRFGADGIWGNDTEAAYQKYILPREVTKEELAQAEQATQPVVTQPVVNNWNQPAPEYKLDSFTPRGDLVHYYGDNTFVGRFNKQQGMNMRRLGLNYIDRNGVTHNMGEMRKGQIRRLSRRERRADINALNNLQAYYEMSNLPNYSDSTQSATINNQTQVNPATGISTQFDSLMNNYYKTRGYQQGGKMNDEQLQQAFIQFLAQKSGAKNEKELEAYVKQLGEDGLKQAYAEFTEVMQKQTQKAKQGAKLNYIRQLKHQCPEGQEPYYYKKGGMVNCGCKGVKMEDGGKSPKQSAVEKFKARKAQTGVKLTSTNSNDSTTVWTDKDEKEMEKLAIKHASKKTTSEEQKRLKALREKFKKSSNLKDYELQEGKCGGKIKKHENGGTLVRFLLLGGGEITRKPSVTKPLPQQRIYYNRPIMMTQPAKTNGLMLAERASLIVGNFGALARVPVKAAYNWMTSPAGTNIKNQEARINRNKTSWDLGKRFLGLKNGGNLK